MVGDELILLRSVPHDRRGYAVDVPNGVVHTRYPTHGEVRPRVRNIAGVRLYLQGDEGRPCERCYPPTPEELEAAKRELRRRKREIARMERAGAEPFVLRDPSDSPTEARVSPESSDGARDNEGRGPGASTPDRPDTSPLPID